MYFDHIYPILPFTSPPMALQCVLPTLFPPLKFNFFYIPLSLISVYRYVPSTVTWATYE